LSLSCSVCSRLQVLFLFGGFGSIPAGCSLWLSCSCPLISVTVHIEKKGSGRADGGGAAAADVGAVQDGSAPGRRHHRPHCRPDCSQQTSSHHPSTTSRRPGRSMTHSARSTTRSEEARSYGCGSHLHTQCQPPATEWSKAATTTTKERDQVQQNGAGAVR
jgi:hypothetical protein